MRISVSSDGNQNYLAKIVKISNIRKHEHADKLQVVTIDGANIIVGMDQKIGDMMIYFPTESAINPDFLKRNNLYENTDMNEDNTKKGYIGKNGRVRAIRLRNLVSRAVLIPVQSITNWNKNIDISNIENFVDSEFDTIDGYKICWKYVIQRPNGRGPRTLNDKSKRKKDSFDRIIPEQFHFHIDTPQLARNIEKIHPESYIQITSKLHGTSGICSHVLVNRKTGWFKKLLYKFLGEQPKEYGIVASSRKVIKDESNANSGFYSVDIWSHAAGKIRDFLPKGMTVYFEMVGYLPETDTLIQQNYDYGYAKGEYGIYIYRITSTNADGDVIELTANQVKSWCQRYGFNMVPELYYGKAKDLFKDIELDENWNENFFARLKESFYMEGSDPMCANNVYFEGIVLRVDNWNDIEVYKLKSDAFYMYETKVLDSGVADIETLESEDQE